jgi:hypothetical protein
MNVVVLWYIAPCSPYVNQHFGRAYHRHLHGKNSAKQETSVQQVARQNKSPARIAVI